MPVIQAAGFNALINTNTSGVETEDLTNDNIHKFILHTLEYDYAHLCCNSVKSNIPFIGINDDSNLVEILEDNLCSVLRSIKSKLTQVNGIKCIDPITINVHADSERIKEYYLDPLVYYLNVILTSPVVLLNTITKKDIIQLFYISYIVYRILLYGYMGVAGIAIYCNSIEATAPPHTYCNTF